MGRPEAENHCAGLRGSAADFLNQKGPFSNGFHAYEESDDRSGSGQASDPISPQPEQPQPQGEDASFLTCL